jgi:hypothetical protein
MSSIVNFMFYKLPQIGSFSFLAVFMFVGMPSPPIFICYWNFERFPWIYNINMIFQVTCFSFLLLTQFTLFAEEAKKIVQPSLRREGLSSVPDVTWNDVGGLDSLRKEFNRCIVRRIKSPEFYHVSSELHLQSHQTFTLLTLRFDML